MSPYYPAPRGFSLLELSIGLLLTVLTAGGGILLAQSVTSGFRLQQNVAAMQENARFALQTILTEAAQAGYRHHPWRESVAIEGLEGSLDGAGPGGDRLVVRRWSQRNCYENPNPVTDASGQPRFFLRVSAFEVTAGGQLTMSCHYGADASSLGHQINSLGLVEYAVSFQVLCAEDGDGDGWADGWARLGQGAGQPACHGIQVGLALASPGYIGATGPGQLQVLDETVSVPTNGRIHRVFHASERIRRHDG